MTNLLVKAVCKQLLKIKFIQEFKINRVSRGRRINLKMNYVPPNGNIEYHNYY